MLRKIYEYLPSPARSVAASAYGYYMRGWRYGKETEQMVKAALERDMWDRQRRNAEQSERLAQVLRRAVVHVPYYREFWLDRKRSGEALSWEVIENWPILEKGQVRDNPMRFLADDCRPSEMLHTHTSGTTGTPLQLWQSREALHVWYAFVEARWRRWYGVSRSDRWALIGGQMVVPVRQRKPPFWVWNHAFRQLYLSAYHLAPDLVGAYLDAMLDHRVVYIYGYTSALFTLAQEALRQKRRDVALKVAITNAEPISEYQREVIGAAFHCPVRETYGMSEMVAAASECEYGALHLWPFMGHMEVMENGVPVPEGTVGDLICTGLVNTDMPLIRYRVGDRGALAPQDEVCSCGRSLPRLAMIEGRTDDLLYTSDGRRVGRLDPVFKANMPIREAQIIQKELDRIEVRYVPLPEFQEEHGLSLAERIRERMGEVRVELRPVKEIPRGANGKFRAVICEIEPPRE